MLAAAEEWFFVALAPGVIVLWFLVLGLLLLRNLGFQFLQFPGGSPILDHVQQGAEYHVDRSHQQADDNDPNNQQQERLTHKTRGSL